MNDGFELYPLSGAGSLKTFPVNAVNESRYVRYGAFGEKGKVVVCGSHHGRAYVFDATISGKSEPIQVLKHGTSKDMVQVVTVRLVSCQNYNTNSYLGAR